MLERIQLNKDFWRIDAQSDIFLSCPLFGACSGGTNFTDNGDSYCEEGYMGPLCAVVSK